ncbi:glycosyltransferase [Muribaculaceae bacterium Isolate-002 (NCI)]|nr:glycosyltransferase [Muribaculaceae bacterium Isolate-002 (NCI)]
MKIVVTGTRGIPDISGGVETHCENLYPRIAAMGHDVTVIRRRCYVDEGNRREEYKGVKLVDLYTPRKKSLEAIIHTFLAVIKARRMKADVLHVHAIGPSIMVPLARMLGMKVVMTNHGPDYDRGKWGRMAKLVLKTGERWGTRFSNRVIVISTVIAGILRDKYGRDDTDLIYNGVNRPATPGSDAYIRSLGLEPGKYIVTIGRFVKEKGFHDLIAAYRKLNLKDIKLAIAGDSDHPDQYSEELKRMGREAGVVFTGFIKGDKLNQLGHNAALFVLPSYHEGLPIALLEAMSEELDVVVSDIPANRIKELEAGDFFPVGDVDALAGKIKDKLERGATPRSYDLSNYNWDRIAEATVKVYEKALGGGK